MNKTFFGFAMSDSMFAGDLTATRKELTVDEVCRIMEAGVEPCLNPSHEATITAMEQRYNLRVTIPAVPPRVELTSGDRLVVMTVRNLPRLTDRHEYSAEEVAQASFTFAVWTVM